MLVCVAFMANAQLQHEDFNTSNMPDGWSSTETLAGNTWEFGYTGDLKGSGLQNPASFETGGVVFNDYKYGGFKNNVVELISPAINLTKKNIVVAKIEVTYNLRTFSKDGSFSINVWDGQAWQNVLTATEDTNAKNSGENQTNTIDVSPYINDNFKVKFVYDDNNSLTWGVGIDDYKLTGQVASKVKGLESLGFSYFPNPVVDGELTLLSSKEISSIAVYNAIGQKVISKKNVTLESKLDMRNLATGTYMVQVVIDDKIGSFKILKP